MAPKLRSRARTANGSRQASPLDVPQNNTALAGSYNSRPKKQRKTSANTSVPVNSSEEPERQKKRKTRVGPQATGDTSPQPQGENEEPQASVSAPVRAPAASSSAWPVTGWKEPRPAKLKPSFYEVGGKRTGIFQSQFALGARPTKTNLRIAKLLDEDDEPKSAPKPKAKKSSRGRVSKSRKSKKSSSKSKKSAKSDQALENALSNDSTTTTTSRAETETPGTTSAQEDLQSTTEDSDPNAHVSDSESGRNLENNDTTPTNAIVPPIPVQLKCTKERFNQVIGSAISRADARNDSKVADGIRIMLQASATDPFLLKIMDDVVADPTTGNMTIFQTALRDAIKKARSEQPIAATVPNKGREDSTSSLSTAKSLEADAFGAPSSAACNVRGPDEDDEAQASESEYEGWEPLQDEGAGVDLDQGPNARRRRALDPALLELAAKKRKLRVKKFPQYHVEPSHVRTEILPQHQPSPKPVCRTEDDDDDDLFKGPAAQHASTARPTEVDNIDFCRKCNGTGNLLCCDGCVDSFHFACLNPPLDPNSPPAGRWFCPACEGKGPSAALEAAMDAVPHAYFKVPSEIREEFVGVQTEDDGTYQLIRQEELPPTAKEVRKLVGKPLEEARAKVYVEVDAQGNLVFCAKCHRSNWGSERQVIQCDHCSLWWHLDCLDENFSHPPLQFRGSDNPRHYWKCPNHLDNMLDSIHEGARLRRRRRHQEHVDIEVLPSAYDTESFRGEEIYGKEYRVAERGLIQNFVEHVKREYAADRALLVMKSVEEHAQNLLAPSGGVSGPSSETRNAGPKAARRSLRTDEREGALALLAMSGAPQPTSSRVEQLVSQLVTDSPETIRNSTSETELLQSLHGLIGQRLKDLAATSSADVTN
ncbi:hypothetical protein LOZ58_005954 [Ophidiomyces ophidiicola]|nr:hypothetical protein LOZ58_005954 [Ophidiomyces ophidiicola]